MHLMYRDISPLPRILLIQQKLFYADILYSAVILPRFNIVFYNHYFSKGVVYTAQGVRFLSTFFRIIYGQCGLYTKASPH